jgi:hypothetical protein
MAGRAKTTSGAATSGPATPKPPRKRGPRRPAAPPATPERTDSADAFIPDPDGGPARTSDDLAELLGEDFVQAATRGNDVLEDDLDQPLSDEIGGPFVMTKPREEFAEGTDESNPADAEPEALPKPVAGLVQRPRAEALDALGDEDEDEDEDPKRARDDEDEDEEGVRAEDVDEGEEASAEDEDEDEEEEEEEEDEEALAASALDEGDDEEEDLDDLDDGTRRRTR